MLGPYLFWGFFALSFAYAVWKGGAPERAAAMILLAGLIGSIGVEVILREDSFASIPVKLVIVDIILGAALLLLAVHANRLWLIFLAACQLSAVISHLARLIAPEMMPLGYAFLVSLWSIPMTGLLIFGTWCHQKRKTAGHLDRPWKTSSHSSASTARI